MKTKICLFLIILILIPNFIYAQDEEPQVYKGLLNGEDLIKAVQFKDITGSTNWESITKMSIYSLIREYGSAYYKPKSYVKRTELLSSLVRTIGKEEEAIQINSKLENSNDYYMAYIQIAKQSGIITPKELEDIAVLSKAENAAIKEKVNKKAMENWKMTVSEKNKLQEEELQKASNRKINETYANRYEAALWLIRALDIEPTDANAIQSVYRFKDWKELPIKDIPYIETLLVNGVLKGGSNDKFIKSSKLTREEWAATLDAALSINMEKAGLGKGKGKVTKIMVQNHVSPLIQTRIVDIQIISPENQQTIIRLTESKDNEKITKESIPVLKNNNLKDENLIEENDVIEYTYNDKEQIILIEIMKHKEMKGIYLNYDKANNTVNIADENGKTYKLKLNPNTIITRNKIKADLRIIGFRAPVTIVYTNDTLISLDAN